MPVNKSGSSVRASSTPALVWASGLFFFFLNGVYSLLYLMDEGLDSSGEED